MDIEKQIQISLMKKYSVELKQVRQTIEYVGPDELCDIFVNRGSTESEALKLADDAFKTAEAEVFLQNHPEAPRKWRSKGKEF